MQKGKNDCRKISIVRIAALLLVSIYALTVADGSAEKKSTNNFGLEEGDDYVVKSDK